MVTPANCGLCSRPAAVEVDVRLKLYWGGWRKVTWVVCEPHREVLADRLARLDPSSEIIAERKAGGERP